MKSMRLTMLAAVIALAAVVLVPTADAQHEDPARFAVTDGSGDSTPMRTTSAEGPESSHGTRVYCVTSHLAYDDPVVHPGLPGAAHLHTFWGNTQTDSASTGQSLLGGGNSSCEGGINNRSAYWVPTLFDELGQAMIPEEIFVYYKSFGGPNFDRTTIQPVPNGLEMLATPDVERSWVTDFRVQGLGGDQLQLSVWFPVCIAVDESGSPILSSDNNTSHLSYGSAGDGNGSDCPDTHPYRIPQVSYHLVYDVDPTSGWQLSSDESAATQGDSLHADYIAAWDSQSMDGLTQCNILARQHCEFGDFDGHRQQLPERFTAPNGELLYASSVALTPTADRTPFGATLTKMQTGSHGGHGKVCQGRTVTIDMNTNGGNGKGTAGSDVILGTPGDDVIQARAGDDYICAGGGDDLVYGSAGDDVIDAGPGNDTLNGNLGADLLSGGSGNDTVNGNLGEDILSGGPGADTVNGGQGNDIVFGGSGNDTVNGNLGEDILSGGQGNDTLSGSRGNDELFGNAGDDIIFGGHGLDTCRGRGSASAPISCER